MKKNYKQGFTLIELLVVIAIIGILASVVLASLNSARSKGSDAAVKANLANARAQAELYYDANGNAYTGVCGTTAVSGVNPVNAMIQQASNTAGTGTVVVNGASQTATTANCNAAATAWAAEVPLKNSISGTTQSYYCVDNTGASKATVTALATGVYACS